MAGASPETMSTSVATPLERHLGAIADVDEMTSRVRSARPASCCSSTSTATSTARRATCRRRSTRRAPICRRRCDPIRPIASSIPPTSPIMILALTSETLTPGQIYDSASNILQQKLSQVAGVGDVQLGGARCRPCASISIRAPCSNTASGWRMCAPRCPRANANAPKARSSRAAAALSRSMSTTTPARRPIISTLIVAYRNNAAVRLAGRRQGLRRRRERPQSRHGQRQARHSGDPLPSSPAPTSSRRSTTSRRTLPQLQASLAARHPSDRRR